MPKHQNITTQQEEIYGYLYKTAFSQQDTYFNSNRSYPADWGNCENISGIKDLLLFKQFLYPRRWRGLYI